MKICTEIYTKASQSGATINKAALVDKTFTPQFPPLTSLGGSRVVKYVQLFIILFQYCTLGECCKLFVKL